MRVRPLDIVILVISTAVIAVASVWAYGPKADAQEVVIKAQGGEYIYPLSTDREIGIQGPLGTTRVGIRNKTVRIEDSPCPNKICVAQGAISKPGQWVACLPNQVLVSVQGDSDNAGIDASAHQ